MKGQAQTLSLMTKISAYSAISAGLMVLFWTGCGHASNEQDTRRYIQVEASNSKDRTQLSNLGMSIEAVTSDSVWGFADQRSLEHIQKSSHTILGNFSIENAHGGHGDMGAFDFPNADKLFHNFSELKSEFDNMVDKDSSVLKLESLGKSVEGRDLWALHINTSKADLETGVSSKPGVVIFGGHHAREHLSVEVPLMLAQYLIKNRSDTLIGDLVDNRDIWIIPMVNPDGAEFDIKGNQYHMWRKNRKPVSFFSVGVDLNRNYGFHWGGEGSSGNPMSDVYHGPSAFSEPETQAVKKFLETKVNTKVLISFHSFSELVLYPWGYTDSAIEQKEDHDTFKKMADTMAEWNHYKPMQSSELYIASGDTTDWAYSALGIFAFTFELSPTSMAEGGFYPGAARIEKTFEANLKPFLYALDVATDPHQVLRSDFESRIK